MQQHRYYKLRPGAQCFSSSAHGLPTLHPHSHICRHRNTAKTVREFFSSQHSQTGFLKVSGTNFFRIIPFHPLLLVSYFFFVSFIILLFFLGPRLFSLFFQSKRSRARLTRLLLQSKLRGSRGVFIYIPAFWFPLGFAHRLCIPQSEMLVSKKYAYKNLEFILHTTPIFSRLRENPIAWEDFLKVI